MLYFIVNFPLNRSVMFHLNHKVFTLLLQEVDTGALSFCDSCQTEKIQTRKQHKNTALIFDIVFFAHQIGCQTLFFIVKSLFHCGWTLWFNHKWLYLLTIFCYLESPNVLEQPNGRIIFFVHFSIFCPHLIYCICPSCKICIYIYLVEVKLWVKKSNWPPTSPSLHLWNEIRNPLLENSN